MELLKPMVNNFRQKFLEAIRTWTKPSADKCWWLLAIIWWVIRKPENPETERLAARLREIKEEIKGEMKQELKESNDELLERVSALEEALETGRGYL